MTAPLPVKEKVPRAEVFVSHVVSYQTWQSYLLIISLTILLIACGVWCLLAARHVKEDASMLAGLDDSEKDKNRPSAGSDLSTCAIEMEADKEINGKTAKAKGIAIGVAKSLIFAKST